MKFKDLTAEEQKLLNTDLGEFDKVAAAEVALAQEMYATGFEKLATETADYLDSMFEKVAAEDDKEDKEDDKEDEETKKTAAELGAFIERGFFDGLRKLGAERHGDETVYLLPYLEEKVAEGGAYKALKEFGSKAWKATKEAPGKAGKAISEHNKELKQHAGEAGKAIRQTVTGKMSPGGVLTPPPGWRKGRAAKAGKETWETAKKTAPYAAGAGAVGGAGWLATRKKKED